MTGGPGRYLLAVDAGTGSCRALLFSVTGEQVAVSLREWTHREPPDAPGGQDFDVEGNWTAITACIRDALSAAGATGGEGAAERIFAEAGDWVSITSPARLRWLARHRPDILGRIHGLGMLSDWITY